MDTHLNHPQARLLLGEEQPMVCLGHKSFRSLICFSYFYKISYFVLLWLWFPPKWSHFIYILYTCNTTGFKSEACNYFCICNLYIVYQYYDSGSNGSQHGHAVWSNSGQPGSGVYGQEVWEVCQRKSNQVLLCSRYTVCDEETEALILPIHTLGGYSLSCHLLYFTSNTVLIHKRIWRLILTSYFEAKVRYGQSIGVNTVQASIYIHLLWISLKCLNCFFNIPGLECAIWPGPASAATLWGQRTWPLHTSHGCCHIHPGGWTLPWSAGEVVWAVCLLSQAIMQKFCFNTLLHCIETVVLFHNITISISATFF